MLIDLDEIWRAPPPVTDWLVTGLIARGTRVVAWGDPGSLKSYLAMDLAVHLALGRAWFGFDIPTPCRVLYLDAEMGVALSWRRLRQLKPADTTINADQLKLLAQEPIMFVSTGPARLLARLGTWSPNVVVIDTLRRVNPGSENSNDDMAALWRTFDDLATHGMPGSERRTLLILHHTAKERLDAPRPRIQRGAGAGDFGAGPDLDLDVQRVVSAPNTADVRIEKGRHGQSLPAPLRVRVVNTGPPEQPDATVRVERVELGGWPTHITPPPSSAVLSLLPPRWQAVCHRGQ